MGTKELHGQKLYSEIKVLRVHAPLRHQQDFAVLIEARSPAADNTGKLHCTPRPMGTGKPLAYLQKLPARIRLRATLRVSPTDLLSQPCTDVLFGHLVGHIPLLFLDLLLCIQHNLHESCAVKAKVLPQLLKVFAQCCCTSEALTLRRKVLESERHIPTHRAAERVTDGEKLETGVQKTEHRPAENNCQNNFSGTALR